MRHGRVKVMLVGCGVQGEMHLRSYLEMGDVDLVVCEASEARLKELNARYPQLKYASDFYEALDQLADELDAVDICTPTKTHYKLVMAALKADLLGRPHFMPEHAIPGDCCLILVAFMGLLAIAHPSLSLALLGDSRCLLVALACAVVGTTCLFAL